MNNDDLMSIADYIEEIESLLNKLISDYENEIIVEKAFVYTKKIMDIVRKEYEKQLGPV